METTSIILSVYIFVGTVLGALLSYVILMIQGIKIQSLYLLSGGIIIGILLFDLISHSINEYQLLSLVLGLLCAVIGCKIL